MTALQPGELLIAVRIPKHWAGARFYFEKVADRNTWDFALVSVAAALVVENGLITQARLACGAVECVPRRLQPVEQAVIGKPHNEATAVLAGQIAVEGAVALKFNGFKVSLMENLVRRALRPGTA